MKDRGARRSIVLLAAGLVAAAGAALAPAYAAGTVTVDRTGNPDFGWDHASCTTGAAVDGDLPQPVEGPDRVAGGAGSLRITAPDDTFTEYDLHGVRSVRDLTSYRINALTTDGIIHVVAALRPAGGNPTFLVTNAQISTAHWGYTNLAKIPFAHYASNHPVFWGEPAEDSGDLAHFVDQIAPDPTTRVSVAFGLTVLGCDENGPAGTHVLHLDRTEIETNDPTEPNAGIIDREPASAPTPVVTAPDTLTITAGKPVTLTVHMTYGDDWPVMDQPYVLESAAPGGDEWTERDSGTTSPTGGLQRGFWPVVNTDYRWRHPADALGYFLESTPAVTHVIVRPAVSAQPVHRSVARDAKVKVRGSVTPLPGAGTAVTLWRWGTRHVRLATGTISPDGAFAVTTHAAKVGRLPLKVTTAATEANGSGRSALMRVHVTR
jgi:hypothetical protein